MSTAGTESVGAVKSLAERLAAIPQVTALSSADHDEAWTLAQTLSDLGAACRAYLEAIPKAFDPMVEGAALLDVVLGLTPDLQHMLYHLEEPRLLRELFAPLRDEWAEERSRLQHD